MGMTNTGHLLVWCLIFLLVTVQMTTTLRPIVGESDALFNFEEKKFFSPVLERGTATGDRLTCARLTWPSAWPVA